MTSPDVTEEEFRNELAALTLGCGAAAMVMARTELVPDAPRYKGGVTRSATEWNKLCRGNLDRMVTDTRLLLIEGIKLAQKTFLAAKQAMGWAVDELDQFVIHRQPPAYRFVREVIRHRPGQGHDHLRRTRQHRPGFGTDRAEQAQGTRPFEEGRPHRVDGDWFWLELLDGGSGLVTCCCCPAGAAASRAISLLR